MANPALNPNETFLTDAIQERLTQARATLNVLMMSMDEDSDWKEVSNVLWAINTLLEQAFTATGDAHHGYTSAIRELTGQTLRQYHAILDLQSALSNLQGLCQLREKHGV